VSLDGD